MKASIVVCCYKGEATIERALECLCHQSFPVDQYEILVIDDGSKDGSAGIITSYIDRRKQVIPALKYFRKENEGLSAARNSGIQQAAGEIIIFVDEDAFADRRFVEEFMVSFETHPDINCFGGRVGLLNSSSAFGSLLHQSIYAWYMASPHAVIGTNMAFRRDFLIAVGGFQEEFRNRGDESALFLKAGDHLRLATTSGPLVYHRQPSSMREWVRTQQEGGFAEGAIDCFARHLKCQSKHLEIRAFGRAVRSVLHFLVVASLPFSWKLSMTLFLMDCVSWSKRYVVDGALIGPLRILHKDAWYKLRLRDSAVVAAAVILGCWSADLGYLKGYMNFRDHSWTVDRPFETL